MKNYFLLAILCFVGAFTLSSQSIYYNYGQDDFLRLEFNRPVFSEDTGSGINFLSFDSYLNGEFTVGGKNKIAFELPYSRLSFDTGTGRNSISQFGNIALAYQVRELEGPSYGEFKIRIPTAENNGYSSSFLFTDYTERFTSIIPDAFSVEAAILKESANITGPYYRFKPGVKVLIPINDNSFNDNMEILLDVNLLGGYRTRKIDFNAGLTSTTILTESNIDFNERVLRQLFSTITFIESNFKPGFIFRLPIGDNFYDSYDTVLGVHFSFIFGGKSNLTKEDRPTGR